MIDIHCHILHGIDDGAQFAEESLKMAQIAEQDGITKIVATPHIDRNEIDKRSFSEINEKREELNNALKRENAGIEILSGAEVHITENIIEKILSNRRHLVINGGSYILLEFPSDHVFSRTKNLFFEMMSEQVIPIIAHPERNHVFMEHPRLLYELILMGSFAQANGGSFAGMYGNKIQMTANNFLRWNFIHFVGSDGHNTLSLSPRLSDAKETISSIYGGSIAQALFHDNPKAVLENEDLPYSPEPIIPKKYKRTFDIGKPRYLRKFLKWNG